MVGPVVAELSKEALLVLASSMGSAGFTKAFDSTATEICACLDVIDKTLVDGFAGRDIEFEKINRGLRNADVSLAKARARLEAAEKNPHSRMFGGEVLKRSRENVAFFEKIQADFEAQLVEKSPVAAATREKLAGIGEKEIRLEAERQGLLGEIKQARDDKEFMELLDSLQTKKSLFEQPLDLTDKNTEIADLEVRLAAIEEKLLALRVERSEALVEKEAAAVSEAPKAADNLIVPDDRLITGSLVPGVVGGGIPIPEIASQAFDALDSTLERVDKSMTRVFANMAVGGASAADELSRIFASLDSDILGSLGSLGGLGSLISKFLGGGPASFLGSLFGLAGGGTAQPGTPILVGERGPEIFLPSGPGRVLNAHNTARAMGGAGAGGQQPLVVQQTINFSTDVKNTVRAEVLNALPLATNIAARQVSDMLRGIRR